MDEKFEDTKGVISCRNSNTERQDNGKEEKENITMIYMTLHIQLKVYYKAALTNPTRLLWNHVIGVAHYNVYII